MNIMEKAARRKSRKRYNLQQKNHKGLPRMTIFRSNKNISVQIIDDKAGKTLASCSSLEKDIKTKGYNKEGAVLVGKKIAERALAKKVKEVIFDIGSYKYHGRVASLIEAALASGLNKT